MGYEKSWPGLDIDNNHTANSKYDNVRPFIPRNMRRKDKTMLLWMVNEKYIHYTD